MMDWHGVAVQEAVGFFGQNNSRLSITDSEGVKPLISSLFFEVIDEVLKIAQFTVK